MTVCIATLFRWNYSGGEPPFHGIAALTASDRMLSTVDIQYEPKQQKICFISNRAILLIAGEIGHHSQAIKITTQELRGRPEMPPREIALAYGRAIRAVRLREAEETVLAPLGLNSDTFLAQQKEMSDSFIRRITDQLQDYEGANIEALVVGVSNTGAREGEESDNAEIYSVDYRGRIDNYNDVGFSAIGIGAFHARSRLMQMGYTNTAIFAPALAAIFAAKRSAEVAPGVGAETDFYLITKFGVERVLPKLENKVRELYLRYETENRVLGERAIEELKHFIGKSGKEELTGADDKQKEQSGRDT